MRPRPVAPARIEWRADGVPLAADYGDVYHARVGALEQSRHVFLGGNGLPARWAGRNDFTIVEAGFGLGHNFVATWDAWQHDARRCARLHYVAIELHPPSRADLERAHDGAALQPLASMLAAAWPAPIAGLHGIDFEEGALQLLLGFGDIEALLPRLVCRADAFFLDGFAPPRNPAMWSARVMKALARRAAPGATAATWSVARSFTSALAGAGFVVDHAAGIGGKREITRAVHAPRYAVHRVGSEPAGARRAVVVGAGLAGACTAAALVRQGFAVEVLDSAAVAAAGASGNVAGLFHDTVHGDDGIYARLYRAAALAARGLLRELDARAPLPASLGGLLRLERDGTPARMRALLERHGLPAQHVQALDAAAAGSAAGVPLPGPAWLHAAGGWVSPRALVQRLLDAHGIALRGGCAVAAIAQRDGGWHALDAAGVTLAAAPALVLANAHGIVPLLEGCGLAGWPERTLRGQITLVPPRAHALRLPLAGDGYAIPLPDGGIVCGATTGHGDDTALSEDDQRANLERLQRLTGIAVPAELPGLGGRAGQRVQTDDKLPVAGPVADAAAVRGRRTERPDLAPRVPGLHVLGALGGRGITLAPLLGRLVAARIAGSPWPLERDLADAVDPARWLVRAARKDS